MNGFDLADVEHLRCPSCGESVDWKGKARADGVLHYGALICPHHHTWRIEAQLPNFVERHDQSLKDRVVDVVYDVLAPVHDMSVSYLLPLIQYPDDEPVRFNYMQMLALDELPTGSDPIRILEVGCGTGANFPLLKHGVRNLPRVEIWAVDFNTTMLDQCSRAYRNNDVRFRLALADAHDLPFADDTFDRVFHVGGINIYRDAARGLEEMARVAKPDTPIVVVDEGLDRERDHHPLHRLAFLLLTSLDNFTGAPVDLLPENCEIINVRNISRFYYGMAYRKKSA